MFANSSRRRRHEKMSHEVKSHQCSLCGKKYAEKYSLVNHYRANHTNIRPYLCQFCQKAFATLNYKNTHEKLVHLKTQIRSKRDLKMKCSFCERTFKTHSGRNVHERTHTQEKPIACRFCPASFKNHSNRNRHEKKAHADD